MDFFALGPTRGANWDNDVGDGDRSLQKVVGGELSLKRYTICAQRRRRGTVRIMVVRVFNKRYDIAQYI